MKKVLFASTALVAAGLMTSGTAMASEKITLNLGGFSKWWVVGQWNSGSYEQGLATTANVTQARAYNNVDVKGDNEVWFGGSTTLDNGMKIGVQIELEAGGHTDQTTDTIDESFVYIEGGFGKFIVGTKKNGTYLLHVNAPDAAGNWGEGGIMTGTYAIAKPKFVNTMAGGNTTAIATTNSARAITYVAPTFYGLTVGASYLPSGTEDNRGMVNLNSANAQSCGVAPTAAAANATCSAVLPIQEVYGVGALYANTFGGVGVKVSAGAVTGHLAGHAAANEALGGNTALNLPASWMETAYGTQISYAGFTLGGSYRNQKANYSSGNNVDLAQWGWTTLGTNITANSYSNSSYANGNAFDIGLSYASGPYAVSFSYFKSQNEHCRLACGGVNASGAVGNQMSDGKDTAEFYQASGKYNLGPGVDVLGSVGYAIYNSAFSWQSTSGGSNPAGTNANNSGWTVMSGLSLTF